MLQWKDCIINTAFVAVTLDGTQVKQVNYVHKKQKMQHISHSTKCNSYKTHISVTGKNIYRNSQS